MCWQSILRLRAIARDGEDGHFAGHFVLMKSWLPVVEDCQKRRAFPFGTAACSTATAPASATPSSELSAASSAPHQGTQDPSSNASPSSAAKPAAGSAAKPTAAAQPASTSAAELAASSVEGNEAFAAAADGMSSLSLREVSSRLSSQPSEMLAQQLLVDIPILQEWQRTPNPSHKVRDAMMKLGSHWKVAQKSRGQKRRPAEVAKELEERMLEKGKELLTSSVAQPAPQTGSSPVKASAPKKLKTADAAAQRASLRDMFARQKRAVAPSTVAESTDAEPPASQGTPKQPRLQHSSSSTAHAEPRPEAAQQSLQPTVQQTQRSESTPSIPSAAAEGNAKPRLQDLLQQLKGSRA